MSVHSLVPEGLPRRGTALVVVDIQPDFLPGGALAVPDGGDILKPVAGLMTANRWQLVVATQDWHPAGHISFASSHPGRSPFDVIDLYGAPQTLWPDHCVQDSPGARLHPDLPWERARAIIRKGTDPQVDSYSAFRENPGPGGARPSTGLAGYLRELAIRRVVLCGLARDFCVLWSAEDAADAGFETLVLWDLTRPVQPGSDGQVRAALEKRGVTLL